LHRHGDLNGVRLGHWDLHGHLHSVGFLNRDLNGDLDRYRDCN
jgi:hypothetical protein